MEMFKSLIIILLSSVLVNNYVLARFLGICPFLGVSKKLDQATGMGIAVTAVMLLATAVTWPIQYFLLDKTGLGYLQTIVFILVIAGLVQFVEMFLKKTMPAIYSALGIYLPLITTNCAVLGVATLNVSEGYNMLFSVLNGTFSALGFLLAIVLMAGVRERLENSKIPACMKGFPISLVTAGLMAIAFMGFGGLA